MEKDIFLLIPAYNPKESFFDLYIELTRIFPSTQIIIVNDGSSSFDVFDKIQKCETPPCEIISHPFNYGKGNALKTGFKYILNNYPQLMGVITLDCDWQHLPADVRNIFDYFLNNSGDLILGSRFFYKSGVPFHRMLGNTLSAFLFKLKTQVYVNDTQTGLRAIPVKLINEILEINNNDFFYELLMLLTAVKSNIKIKEIQITTVYNKEKNTSHFNPIKDSIKIIYSLFKYKM